MRNTSKSNRYDEPITYKWKLANAAEKDIQQASVCITAARGYILLINNIQISKNPN